MVLRILFLLIAIILIINLVLTGVGAMFGVNLYEKYGKQILTFFAGIILIVVIAYIVFAILGLI